MAFVEDSPKVKTQVSSICVTVIADSGSREDTPRKVTLAATDILSVDDTVSNRESSTPEGKCRIVLIEEVQPRVPWVFSDEDDDTPLPHRELVVTESRRVVDLILGWARAQPRTYSAGDVKEWDDWLAAGMPLREDLVVQPPVKIVRRRPGVPPEIE
jgi:hypothetical protein